MPAITHPNTGIPLLPPIIKPKGFSKEAEKIFEREDVIAADGRSRALNLTSTPILDIYNNNFIFDEIDLVAEECAVENWDGYGAEPVGGETLKKAKMLATLFPDNVPQPEVAAEPDGSIGFEWHVDSLHWMIVSVDGEGNIHYAAKLDEFSKSDGKIDFNTDKIAMMFNTLKIVRGIHG